MHSPPNSTSRSHCLILPAFSELIGAADGPHRVEEATVKIDDPDSPLTRAFDYVVQVEELGRTTLFGTMRHGAGFYVPAGQAWECRTLLAGVGLSHGIVDEQS